MEERLYSVSLSQRAAQNAQIRLAKIIGQLKTVSKMLEESPRDLDALTQYAAANDAEPSGKSTKGEALSEIRSQ